MLPSVTHGPFKPIDMSKYPHIVTDYSDPKQIELNPNQLRWKPLDMSATPEGTRFWQGLHSMAGNGDPSLKHGLGIYNYCFNTSMVD